MSEVSLLVLIEAGEVRSLVGLGFQVQLPDVLIWGPSVLPRIEALAEETERWPSENQLLGAVVIDRDSRRLTRAAASETFDTPYQLVLFDRMLAAVWGYDVETIDLSCQAIADAARIDMPAIDPKLARRMMNATMGAAMREDDEYEDQDEQDYASEDGEYHYGEGDDFRQLTTRNPQTNEVASMVRQYHDQGWFVSVREADGQLYRHYLGDFVMQTFSDLGPAVIGQITQLNEISVPKENHATRGVVVDAPAQTLCVWSHPRGVTMWDELDQAWPEWKVDRWRDNGYRRHLDETGESDHVVVPSDTQALAGFVPLLVEQLDLDEMLSQIKSGCRGYVYRGFGCLAIVLAIPALIAGAVTGSWKGPFAFAGTLWALAYIAYLILATKMKRSFSQLADKKEQAKEMLPKLAPEDKSEREQIVRAALSDAGLPDFDQVQAFAETYDDDDDDDESIDPIVSA